MSALANANRVSKREVESNSSEMETPAAFVLSEMTEVLPMIYKNIDSVQTKRIIKELGTFRGTYSPVLTPNMASEIQYLIQLGGKTISENIAKSLTNSLEKQVETSIINAGTNANSSKIDLKIEAVKNTILQQKADSTIETQISPISNILSKNLDTLNPSTLPQSIQILANYAQTRNLQRFGSISGSKSRAFIGVSEERDGLTSQLVPFPEERGSSGNTPNLMQNFNYFAGRAINSWNQFVRREQELSEYMGKISTKELRKEFVQERISEMTEATFSAEALATLVYYYAQIPLERFLRTSIEKYDGTQESFIVHYLPGDGASKNPFLLSKKEALEIFMALFTNGAPTTIELRLHEILAKFKTGLNSRRINEWIAYPKSRSFSAQQFFENSGIPNTQYMKSLESGYIVGLKTKKFIIPPMFTNPEIVEMVNEVSEKQNSQSSYSKEWRLSWGDDKMMSHDYVWNYEL